jgi:alpha-glucosidase
MTQQPLESLWWQHGVIYQVYPRSFCDSNGDGIGDLPGIISKLDYLAHTLGIDAIWLSPFYPSPMADFGYDISNYTDVDPCFGTLADFDRLVAEAHRRDLKIIIDFVPNHTSDQHPWFIESRASRDNPKRDWYVWGDPKPDGSPPNNWVSNFGGPAWELDKTTGQYYLHSFLKEQPDLNWRNPAVKAAMFDVIRFWLERGVDGFRLDVAHYIMKDPDLRDNPLNLDRKQGFKPMGDYDSVIHLYDKGHVDVHAVLREFRQLLDSYSAGQPRFSVGEIHIFDWAQWATYYGSQLDELHMPFNFSLLFAPWDAQAIRTLVDAIEQAVPPGGWPNFVFGNHDEHRVANRLGDDAARVVMLLLLTLRGTPTIYYGDEIGMHDVTIPPEMEQDPWGKRMPGLSVGRDPERAPMQWNDQANAGFSSADVQPWLPVAPDYAQHNVEKQLTDPRSMLALTQKLLALRRSTPALYAGRYQPLDQDSAASFVYMRTHGNARWQIAVNLSAQDQTLHLPDMGSGTIQLSTYLDRDGPVDLNALRLRGNEGVLIRLP